ncbi:MAG: DsbA family protein [archaeon]
MICVIALIVFGVLGIFSASHRIIAKEAFECVFRRLTLRKCETGLDKRLKAQITGKLMKGWPSLGRQIYKHFELISWMFLILLLVSIFFAGQGIYRFAVYGNCNGTDSNEFCIFDPLNTFGNDEPDICAAPGTDKDKELILTGDFSENPYLGNADAKVTVIEFGCYACPNTKAVVPVVEDILNEFGDEIKLVYVDFPLENHEFAFESAMAANCVWMNEPELYWDYHSQLFNRQDGLSLEILNQAAEDVDVNMEAFNTCMDEEQSKDIVYSDYQKGLDSNIYGTPTFFINEEPLVGVVTFKEFKKIIKSHLE